METKDLKQWFSTKKIRCQYSEGGICTYKRNIYGHCGFTNCPFVKSLINANKNGKNN
jgi:hypothetical protein